MVTALSNCKQPHSGLVVLTLKCVTRCESIIECQNVQYRLCPLRAAITAHNDDAWRQNYFECCVGNGFNL